MLYTFSKADYDQTELFATLELLNENDVAVFWQNGVLQAVKNEQSFAKYKNLYLLEPDLNARGLTQFTASLKTISLAEFVTLSEKFSPQIAL